VTDKPATPPASTPSHADVSAPFLGETQSTAIGRINEVASSSMFRSPSGRRTPGSHSSHRNSGPSSTSGTCCRTSASRRSWRSHDADLDIGRYDLSSARSWLRASFSASPRRRLSADLAITRLTLLGRRALGLINGCSQSPIWAAAVFWSVWHHDDLPEFVLVGSNNKVIYPSAPIRISALARSGRSFGIPNVSWHWW